MLMNYMSIWEWNGYIAIDEFQLFLAYHVHNLIFILSGPSISITPTTNDMTLFQGSEFRRICSIDG